MTLIRRYFVAGALATFIHAGVPPADLVPDEPSLKRQVVSTPRYAPPPLTLTRAPQLQDAAVEDIPEGRFVLGQVITPYAGRAWIVPPALTTPAAGLLPEAWQHIDVPTYIQRPNTVSIVPGAQSTTVVAQGDELRSTRRSIVQPPVPKYQGPIAILQKSTEIDIPVEFGTLVVSLPPYYPTPPPFPFGRVPPPDITPERPISDRIRIVSAIAPYLGRSLVVSVPLLVDELPAAAGTLLIPNPSKSFPDYWASAFIRRQGPPPDTVATAQDEENWASRRVLVVPASIYGRGQFVLGKAPVADVSTAQDEHIWRSRKVIALKSYADLWSNPALTRVLFKQIEDELALMVGNRAIVIPPPRIYDPGQFKAGIIQRPAVIVGVDELLRSRRRVSLAEWRWRYETGQSFTWSPRPDNLIVPIINACISVEQGPITLCTVTEGAITIITWEVEC